MIAYGSNEYDETEVAQVTEYLQNRARDEKPIHYDDVWEVARQFGAYHGPHDKRLWDLLGLISETEISHGRYALSAIVRVKNGEGANRPGTGFFDLARKLGRYKEDDDKTWLAELDGLFKYWPKH